VGVTRGARTFCVTLTMFPSAFNSHGGMAPCMRREEVTAQEQQIACGS